jgi:ubiquinone/menaquinone biosynthesis C-methylase UbiE
MKDKNGLNADLLKRMQRDWDERARENARFYVATLQEEWTDEDFFRSGEIWLHDYILSNLTALPGQRPPKEMRVLEIGCGVGRITRALSKVFGQVDAVDVSGEMIARARRALRDCPNVRLHQNNGADLSMFGAEEFDFACSAIVFQHIPSKAVIENYIRETWRVLQPGSLFKFQAQGAVIDERACDTWVGVGFTEKEMREMAARCNFEILRSDGAGTQYYWLEFLKR